MNGVFLILVMAFSLLFLSPYQALSDRCAGHGISSIVSISSLYAVCEDLILLATAFSLLLNFPIFSQLHFLKVSVVILDYFNKHFRFR